MIFITHFVSCRHIISAFSAFIYSIRPCPMLALRPFTLKVIIFMLNSFRFDGNLKSSGLYLGISFLLDSFSSISFSSSSSSSSLDFFFGFVLADFSTPLASAGFFSKRLLLSYAHITFNCFEIK